MPAEQEAKLNIKEAKEHLIKPIDSTHDDKLTYKNIAMSLIGNSLPTIFYFMTMFTGFALNMHFIGIYNDEYLLDAVGLGNSIMNCTTIAFIISLNVGFISIASQCYGAKNYKLLGTYLHRAFIVNCIILGICFTGLIFVRQLLVIFNIPSQTIEYSTTYIHYNYVMMFLTMIYDTLKSYLMAQNLYLPPMIIQVFITIFQWTFSYIFINRMSLKILGLSLAMALSQVIGVIIMFLYIWISNPRPESWFFFTKNSFKGLWRLLKYEIPIGAMVYLEWIAFEIALIFSGSYPPNQMGGLVVFSTMLSIFYNIPVGLGTTLNSMIGNAIGEKNAIKTKMILRVITFIIIFVIILMEILLYFYGDIVARFFSPDSSIIDITHNIIHIYMIALPFDIGQYIIGGYIRGIGKEETGSKYLILCYYIIGIPLAFTFGNILGYEDIGLWCGLGIAITLLFISYVVIILETNLETQIQKISNKLTNDSKDGIYKVEDMNEVEGMNKGENIEKIILKNEFSLEL